MADDLLGRLSGTGNPYAMNTYTPAANEKNTLTITDYFKLLAAQLANQDMTNPMDNSEMMAQMTQMAMVQSMGAMTDSITTSTAVTSQTYAAGLVGQELTVNNFAKAGPGDDAVLVIRPEGATLAEQGLLEGTVTLSTFMGHLIQSR